MPSIRTIPPPPSGPLPDHSACAARHHHRPSRLRAEHALTLIEVIFAMVLMTMVTGGVLQAMLQSRRMSEGSVRQASVASLVQGYMEQFKSIKFASDSSNALPSSPPATFSGTAVSDWEDYTGTDPDNPLTPPIMPAKDGAQGPISFYLAPGAPPTDLSDLSTLPTGPARHSEDVDIDNPDSPKDDSHLDMWVWINDMTDSTNTNLVQCKSIVIVYQYTVRDGGRSRTFHDSLRAIRSIVPTS